LVEALRTIRKIASPTPDGVIPMTPSRMTPPPLSTQPLTEMSKWNIF